MLFLNVFDGFRCSDVFDEFFKIATGRPALAHYRYGHLLDCFELVEVALLLSVVFLIAARAVLI